MTKPSCELCAKSGDIVFQHEKYRVLLVDDASYPGFCRVIWDEHVKEMSDLRAADRALLMDAVWKVEETLREIMQPDKVNLASFGNVVPHLHWHVIPRFKGDAHFPNPIWGEVKRTPDSSELSRRRALLPRLRKAIVERLDESVF
jgi:diadenosine tetraphosphate (Ap4A) HIT family hydrolase